MLQDLLGITASTSVPGRKDGPLFDERKYNGDYRTKRVILGIYDKMKEAMETGKPYQTILDPPPADPSVAHPDTRDKKAAAEE